MGGTLTPHLAKVGGGEVGEVGGRPVQEPPTPTTSIGRGCGGGGGASGGGFAVRIAHAREGFGSTTRGRARPMAKVD